MTGDFRSLDASGTVYFAADACLELRPAAAACGRCREACPTGAFQWSAAGVKLTSACLGCGRCAPPCPTGALVLGGFEPSAAAAGPASRLRVECRRVPAQRRSPDSVVVPCLGGLAPGAILGIMAERSGAIDLIDRGWCRECPAGGEIHPAAQARAAVGELVEALGLPDGRKPRLLHEALAEWQALPLIPGPDGQALGRRAFFAALLRRTVAATAGDAPAAGPSRGACRPSPVAAAARGHWAATLARLAESAGKALPAALFPSLEAGPDCAHHGVCAAVCPSGALRAFESSDGRAGLDFDAGLCIACGLCTAHCPSGTLRMLPAGNGGETYQPGRHTLVEELRRTCTRCGKSFAGGPGRADCPHCRQQSDLARSLFGTCLADRPPSLSSQPEVDCQGESHVRQHP